MLLHAWSNATGRLCWAALIAVVALSWVYVLAGAGMSMSAFELTRMSAGKGGMAKMMPAVWDIGYAGVMFIMWWVMMIAMMLPSATPMVLLFAAMNRKQKQKGNRYVATAHFACNCAVNCGCQFNLPNTHGYCQSAFVGNIVAGHFNDTPLAGLNWAGLYKWPGEIADGNGKRQIVLDERADEAQRVALETIISGDAHESALP